MLSTIGTSPAPAVAGIDFYKGKTMKGISGKEWVLLSEVIRPEEGLSERLGAVKAQILANRNFSSENLENRLSKLLPPSDIPNIQEAVELISDHVKRGSRIVIFGDYDVDGITGSAILYDLLKQAKARVLPLLPSRRMGYGLSRELVVKLSRYADLLITVDNGSTSVEELSYASIPVVILDHHNLPEKTPGALLVNPKMGQRAEFKELSSSGLVFYLSALLKRELGMDVDVRYYLHLACMGTVADVMPMNYINRIIVYNGMKLLNYVLKGGFQAPGIRLLMERAGIRDEVSSRDIAFSIAPRLNAPGRVARPYVALKLLLEKDEQKAIKLIEKIQKLNQKRKELTQRAFQEALRQAEEQKDQKVLIVKLGEWAGGVGGIVAGRLSALFSRPAIVLSVGKDYSTASVRSIEGIDVYSVLKGLSHFFIKWGGHSTAVGFTIRNENLHSFENLVRTTFSQSSPETGKLYIDMPLPLNRIDKNLYQTLKELEPYGEGFPEPTFLSEPVRLQVVAGSEERLLLRAGSYSIISYDSAVNSKLSLLDSRPRRVVYQIDRRRPNTLLLVDVEE